MWHRAKCEELRPHGHLHCVITADSCRDNRYIQPSSYTQVCRHAHINKDLCAHLVVRSFLTRGWRGSNSLYSLSFSQNCCLLAWTHPHLGAKKREGITLSVSFLSKKNCIFMHLVSGADSVRLQASQEVPNWTDFHVGGGKIMRILVNNWGKTGVCIHFPLLCLV